MVAVICCRGVADPVVAWSYAGAGLASDWICRRHGWISCAHSRSYLSQAQAAAQRDAKTRAMQQDVQALTDAFIQARYASQPIEGAKISFLEQIWQQLKRQLGL